MTEQLTISDLGFEVGVRFLRNLLLGGVYEHIIVHGLLKMLAKQKQRSQSYSQVSHRNGSSRKNLLALLCPHQYHHHCQIQTVYREFAL